MDHKRFLKASCVLAPCAARGPPGCQTSRRSRRAAESLRPGDRIRPPLGQGPDGPGRRPAHGTPAQGSHGGPRPICAKSGAARRAEPFKGKLDEFVADLAAHMGKDAVQRDGDVVKVSYPRCFCPLVAELKEPLWRATASAPPAG